MQWKYFRRWYLWAHLLMVIAGIGLGLIFLDNPPFISWLIGAVVLVYFVRIVAAKKVPLKEGVANAIISGGLCWLSFWLTVFACFIGAMGVGGRPTARDLDHFKMIVEQINHGTIGISTRDEVPPLYNSPDDWPKDQEPSDSSMHKIKLPENMKSFTADGLVHIIQHDAKRTILVFKTGIGHDRSMEGYLYTSTPLASTDIVEAPADLDGSAQCDAIAAFGVDLCIEKTDDPHWYKAYFNLD